MITVENFIHSVVDAYLHFNRVDKYLDFPGADPNDGRQLPKDRQGNASARFAKAPDFSAADYYDQSRARTYACCFSMENSDVIWKNYANGSEKGKVCIVFDFHKLRLRLNQSLRAGNTTLEYNGNRCYQIFSINYGVIEYVEWDRHQANAVHLPNPIKYTYLKGKTFSDEKELRVSLSALGMGQFALNNGSIMDFPANLQMTFNFREAIADETIKQILISPDCDSGFLYAELHKLNIFASKGSDPPLQIEQYQEESPPHTRAR